MRSTCPRPAFVVVVLIAVAAAGCGTAEPLPSATPVASRVDTTTSGSGASSRLFDFESRLRAATSREAALVRAVAAASVGSPAGVDIAVGQLREWADGERVWLTDHPADPCFDAAASKFQTAIDSIAATADSLEASVTATIAPSDGGSVPPAQTEALNTLQDAGRALADAAALARTARPNCA